MKKFKHFSKKQLSGNRGEASIHKGLNMMSLVQKTFKVDCPIPTKVNFKNKKKIMCSTWGEIDKSESTDDFDKERESLSFFLTLSNEVNN